MKNKIFLLFASISLILVCFLYVVHANKGFFHGLQCFFCNEKLPYNLKPHNGEGFSFTLNDEEGFELVGIGFRYRLSEFKIKDILAYGYNDTSMIVKCADSINIIHYIISYQTGYKNKKGNPEISFKDISNENFEQLKDNYRWVAIEEEKINEISRMKSLLMLGALLSFSIIIIILLKVVRSKAIIE